MNNVTAHKFEAPTRNISVAPAEIGLDRGREALNLIAALIPFYSFIVQDDHAHWVVRARVQGCNDQTLNRLFTKIEDCRPDVDVRELTRVRSDCLFALNHFVDVIGEEERL